MKPSLSHGYLAVSLLKKGKRKNKRVHRIVAETFLNNNDKNKNVVNHIDGDKTNNNINNLEWCTQQENVQHALKTGLAVFNPKLLIKNRKNKGREIIQLDTEGNAIREWKTITEAERELGFKSSHISECCSGKCKTSRGFVWRYKTKEE